MVSFGQIMNNLNNLNPYIQLYEIFVYGLRYQLSPAIDLIISHSIISSLGSCFELQKKNIINVAYGRAIKLIEMLTRHALSLSRSVTERGLSPNEVKFIIIN